MVTESKLVVAKGWEGENGSDCLLGPGHPFRSNGIILEVDSVKHTTVYFRMVKTMNFAYANFISTKLKATNFLFLLIGKKKILKIKYDQDN